MDDFELLLEREMPVLERFVRFRIRERFDADDVIQETCRKAFEKRGELRDAGAFKPWLLATAKNCVNDFFRKSAKRMEIPLEAAEELLVVPGVHGRMERLYVRDTLEKLGDREKETLYLYYFRGLSQEEIAKRLGIPLGTVKSRLHYAKQRFKDVYSEDDQEMKGCVDMKKMPEIMPDYRIIPSNEPAFHVKWEELMGWFIVPRLGEELSWAMYDFPEKKRTELCELKVVGRAEVHGIEGVEIASVEYEPMECNSNGGMDRVERHFIAQLTDTHCRFLAESSVVDGVKRIRTFLDDDEFLDNWGFGENNCGNEINIAPKGDVTREGDKVRTADKKFLLDVVGRYTVEINGRSFDTVCVMDSATYMEGEKVVTEQYLDRNGRTVLWRRFNHDEWKLDSYKKRWTEMLPENERLTVNGETYVHWYDCITDRIL